MTENSSKKWHHSVRKRMQVALIVVSIIAFVFLYFYVKQQYEYKKKREENLRHIKNIGTSIHFYYDAFGRLPPAYILGKDQKRLSSWRAFLYPFCGDPPDEYFIPFKMLKGDWHKILYQQHVLYPTENDTSRGEVVAQFVAVEGADTPFEPNKNRTLRDTDTDTILVLTAKHVYLHPFEPRDLSLDYLKELAKLDRNCELFSVDGVGFHVLFSDAEVWYLDKNMPLKEILKFCTIESSKIYDREELLGKFKID